MPTRDDLLLEKRRYDLPQTISFEEDLLLQKGYPVQKIIGYIEMANVKIDLNHFVLIPRYETEELIELVSQRIELLKKARGQRSLRVLDLGTGSGFIGLALAKRHVESSFVLSDIDHNALMQTKINMHMNKIQNVEIIKSDLFQNIEGKFDLIVSNPPYLYEEEIDHKMFLFEPQKALVAEEQGWEIYKRTLHDVKNYLNPKSYLYFEINPSFQKRFLVYNFSILNDLNQKARFAFKKYN